MLANALPLDVDPMALDIVGTGGDRFGTVNVSTMASIVAAAAGVPVVKHGNRRRARASGSSDVLAALGVDLDAARRARRRRCSTRRASPSRSRRAFHPGFRHAGPVRAELGIPTVFNFLGPLCNPARPEASAVGVAHLDTVPLIVGVFQTRGATALVFRGDDGLDELTTTGHSHIWEVSRGTVTEHDLDPRDLGIAARDDRRAARRRRRAQRRDRARACSRASEGPVRDIVLLNAAAGLVACELAKDPEPVPAADPRPVPRQDGGRRGDDRQRRRRAQARAVDRRDQELSPQTRRRGPARRADPRVVVTLPLPGTSYFTSSSTQSKVFVTAFFHSADLALALVGVHLRLPALVLLPVRAQVVEVAPEPDGESGRVGGAERRRLGDDRAHDGTPRMSAWNCMSVSFATMPPSTLSSVRSTPGVGVDGIEHLAGLERRRLERGAGDVALVHEAGEARRARRGRPVASTARTGRRTPARSTRRRCRRRSSASSSTSGALEMMPEVVAQPLDERAGDGDRALERVVRLLVAELVADAS